MVGIKDERKTKEKRKYECMEKKNRKKERKKEHEKSVRIFF